MTAAHGEYGSANWCPGCQGPCACRTTFAGSVECQACTFRRARGEPVPISKHVEADHDRLVRIDFAAGPGGTIQKEQTNMSNAVHTFAERVSAAARRYGFSQADMANPLKASMAENVARHEAQAEYTSGIEGAVAAAARELGIDPTACRTHGPERTRALVHAARQQPQIFSVPR